MQVDQILTTTKTGNTHRPWGEHSLRWEQQDVIAILNGEIVSINYKGEVSQYNGDIIGQTLGDQAEAYYFEHQEDSYHDGKLTLKVTEKPGKPVLLPVPCNLSKGYTRGQWVLTTNRVEFASTLEDIEKILLQSDISYTKIRPGVWIMTERIIPICLEECFIKGPEPAGLAGMPHSWYESAHITEPYIVFHLGHHRVVFPKGQTAQWGSILPKQTKLYKGKNCEIYLGPYERHMTVTICRPGYQKTSEQLYLPTQSRKPLLLTIAEALCLEGYENFVPQHGDPDNFIK